MGAGSGGAGGGGGANGSRGIWVTPAGVQLFSGGSEDFAGGAGVLGLTDATTEPTTVPGAGNLVAWARDGQLKAKGPKGLVYAMSADSSGAQTLSVADVLWWTVATTDDVATVVGTYALAVPAGGQFTVELWVTGVADGTDTRVFFKLYAGGGRAPAGSTTVDFTSGTTALFDAITVAGPPTVTVSANAVRLNARGKAATNITWTFEGTIRIWKA